VATQPRTIAPQGVLSESEGFTKLTSDRSLTMTRGGNEAPLRSAGMMEDMTIRNSRPDPKRLRRKESRTSLGFLGRSPDRDVRKDVRRYQPPYGGERVGVRASIRPYDVALFLRVPLRRHGIAENTPVIHERASCLGAQQWGSGAIASMQRRAQVQGRTEVGHGAGMRPPRWLRSSSDHRQQAQDSAAWKQGNGGKDRNVDAVASPA